MPSTFELGSRARCDLDSLVRNRLLVQANSGGGKSWCIRRILEQTHGRVQHLVIDPEGEFSTLREKFDYVLAARTGGDTAADPRTAKLLAERLLELGVSAILDIYELKHHDRIRFVRLFLEALVEAPKRLWHPALVVVDEGHQFAPQRGEAESAGAVIDLATRGRKRGFAIVLATQRLSKLHKDAAAETNLKIIGRSSLDVDMARASDELGFTSREQQHSLRRLEPGEFYVFGPGLSDEVVKTKIGPVTTTHPRAGGRGSFTPPPPTRRIRALLPKLSDLPAEMEQQARTEAELKARIVVLERELHHARRAAPGPKEVVREVRVLKAQQVASLERAALRLDRAQTAVAEIAGDITKALRAAGVLSGADREPVGRNPLYDPPPRLMKRVMEQTTPQRIVQRVVALPGRVSAEAREMFGDVDIPHIGGKRPGKAERSILAVLAAHGASSKKKVAILSGYAVNGGAFNNALGFLRSSGLINRGEPVDLTDAGRAATVDVDSAPTGHQAQEFWIRQLPKAEREILGVLIKTHPETLTPEEIAERTPSRYAAKGGGFANALGRLRTLGLAVGYGHVSAATELF